VELKGFQGLGKMIAVQQNISHRAFPSEEEGSMINISKTDVQQIYTKILKA